jgi:Prolyl oligopeptidase family
MRSFTHHPLLFGLFCWILTFSSSMLQADGPADNQDAEVRRIPPIGLDLSPDVRSELEDLVREINRMVPAVSETDLASESMESIDWWNDVRVIIRAVRLTLDGQQFYKDAEIDQARKLLKLAREYASELNATAKEAKQANFVPSWGRKSGRIVGGHLSRLDDSVQPFGIIVPEQAEADPKKPRRLDIWLHGRDENVSEVAFLYRRWTQDSQYLPEDTFVLQPWGRYSNAFRFAGEVDVLEVLGEVQRRYAIDPDRISIRGFSMGGAGCWHLAVHHPHRFFAANPGAGFCETERFLTGFQSETLTPTASQRRLWSLYDCPPVVRNLINLPTIAYSGGMDRQKEAADIMTEAATQAGFTIPYVIHPDSAHVIHADAKKEIESKMSELAKQGRKSFPPSISWSTYSLKYPGAYWLRLSRLGQHWTKATIEASFTEKLDALKINTENIRSFEIDVPPDSLHSGGSTTETKTVSLSIDGRDVGTVDANRDGSMFVELQRDAQGWNISTKQRSTVAKALEKRPGLQGPIDDAFLSRFLIVRPTGSSNSSSNDRWVDRELQHAIDHWRLQFRGEARVKADVDVTEADLRDSNVICFGTPESNRLIATIVNQMPIRWSTSEIIVGDQTHDSSKVVPVLIYPNPLASHRYVVFNSGFTYREYDYLNNARQTPKLPDWAMIDTTSPPTSRAPGRILSEGFFNEQWLP